MKKKNSEIFDDLQSKIWYPFFLFAPRKYFENFMSDQELEPLDWAFDRIVFARAKMDILFMDENEVNHDLFKKQTNLNENLFDLVDLYSELNPIQFEFLLEKYKDNLLLLDYFFDLMLKEIVTGKNNEYSKYVALFMIQLEYIKAHQEAVDQAFPSYVEKYKREINYDAFLIDTITEKKEPPTEASDMPKKKLISDIESQNFILNSVFKINTSGFN